jgi:hypothetical protein
LFEEYTRNAPRGIGNDCAIGNNQWGRIAKQHGILIPDIVRDAGRENPQPPRKRFAEDLEGRHRSDVAENSAPLPALRTCGYTISGTPSATYAGQTGAAAL